MTDTQALSTTLPEPVSVSQDFIVKDEHPLLQIPFSAQVGDRRYEGESISITHAVVSGLTAPSAKQEACHVVFRFDFDGFSINLFLIADLEKTGSSESSEHKLRFCDPSGAHLAPLRYIINSSLAGDLVTMDRLIGYSGPTQEKRKQEAPKVGFLRKAGRIVRHTSILGMSLLLILFAGNVLRERVTYGYEARPVMITTGSETLIATAAGQVTYVNDSAEEGQVVYTIGANSGQLLSVKMPCDCEAIASDSLYEGATILAGTPLLQLARNDAELVAQTQISFEGASRYLSGNLAELEFVDGSVIPVTLRLIQSSNSATNQTFVPVEIQFEGAEFEELAAGKTARLRFKRSFAIPEQLNNFLQSAYTRIAGS